MHDWLRPGAFPVRTATRSAITAAWLADEAELTRSLADRAQLSPERTAAIQVRAAGWVRRVRGRDGEAPALESFMREYDLGSEEGVLLMCLAEALLRIPDEATAQALIADKLGGAAWSRHLGHSGSVLVNASTWGLVLTGRVLRPGGPAPDAFDALRSLAVRVGEPVIRLALRQAMRLMARQFVMGRTIADALARSRDHEQRRYRHSFDMLGEAAVTAEDAQRYLHAYLAAIEAIGNACRDDGAGSPHERPGISVKLSALHPRYESAQAVRVQRELVPHLLQLAQAARRQGIGLTVDAEEADRLELSLDVIEPVFCDASLSGWDGFGLAVQAFQKRGAPVLDWLHELAGRAQRHLAVRLVKGAYWDTEIKRAQEQGLAGYPVFTRKARTDLAYLACARRLLDARGRFYPMLATHNAHTLAAVHEYAGDERGYEFQRLHGMGDALYGEVVTDIDVPCRVYAPVGSHEDLLPYLVRRLLENGANTSFVNRIHDTQRPPEELVADPACAALQDGPELPPPRALFEPSRQNSSGLNLADESQLRGLAQALGALDASPIETVTSLVAIDSSTDSTDLPGSIPVVSPADREFSPGAWLPFDASQLSRVMDVAESAFPAWSQGAVDGRAALLETAADALEAQRARFIHLLVLEAGKTLADAAAEVREATDFLRYYAAEARRLMGSPQHLPGPAGEDNVLGLHARGVFACISPWNFPLAIFTGQIAAALAAGNPVVAKPAEQTPLVAVQMTRLLHDAGIPREVLQLVLGAGEVGNALVADPRVAGVAFTGSLAVAQAINRRLAARSGAIAVLIAETGGQNAMIADSSALPEQVVRDALRSAFGSAGQRCSALRVLYLQEEIADRVIGLLRGALREWVVGDPVQLATDIGPIIDAEALARLERHVDQLRTRGQLIEQAPLPPGCERGHFLAPCLAQIDGIESLDAEHFGPILHLVRYAADALDAVVDRINASGFGLTLGIHSRIESRWRHIQARARVGNVYVNRGMTGAVVGSQPFGGENGSGTGPKAGGPNYLLRFTVERAVSLNTAAVGGDARLLNRVT